MLKQLLIVMFKYHIKEYTKNILLTKEYMSHKRIIILLTLLFYKKLVSSLPIHICIKVTQHNTFIFLTFRVKF